MADTDDDVATGEVVLYPAVEAALFDGALVDEDPNRAAREIVQSILDAESADEVLAETEVTHARDMLDEAFVALGVHFHSSDFAGEGSGVYAVIDGATKDGDKLTITCGARNVVAQLYRLATLNAFPRPVMIVERGRPKDGKAAPMRLVAPDNF